MNKNGKPVYMYNMLGDLLKEFKDTGECAEYFDKDPDYINHNLKYCKKIRKDHKWFIIKRHKLKREEVLR